MGGKRVDLDDVGRKLETFAAAGVVGALPQQDDLAKAARVQKPALDAAGDSRRDAPWEHDRRNQAGADDAERDFFKTRNRSVENRAGLGHRGEADQRDRVSGEHEDVAAWRTIEQR